MKAKMWIGLEVWTPLPECSQPPISIFNWDTPHSLSIKRDNLGKNSIVLLPAGSRGRN